MFGFQQNRVRFKFPVKYGYRIGTEKYSPDKFAQESPGNTVRIVNVVCGTDHLRKFVRCSLGMHVIGASFPQADPDHIPTIAYGVFGRVGRCLPTRETKTFNRFSQFVRQWVRNNISPIDIDTDLSVETWLVKTNYTEVRKNQLRTADSLSCDKWFKDCKCFIKDEGYKTIKNARGIYSRTDKFKTMVGPVFSVISDIFLKRNNFIKYVPTEQRPQYIESFFEKYNASNQVKYMSTDYTAYESHFTATMFESIEFCLYDWCIQNLPQRVQIRNLFEVFKTENVCKFKNIKFKIKATRMSGEMNTSLGNSFVNLMAYLFIHSEKGNRNYDCLIEGDDCLGCFEGQMPTNYDYEKLGLTVKIVPEEKLNEASFCGQIYDSQYNVIADPIKMILNFGWIDKKYCDSSEKTRNKLLKCKALSYVHQYPNCPVIGPFCQHVIKLLSKTHYKIFFKNNYEKRMKKTYMERTNVPETTVLLETRLLVEKIFHVPIEYQITLENYLTNIKIEALNHPLINELSTLEQFNFDVWHVHPKDYVYKTISVNNMPTYLNETKQIGSQKQAQWECAKQKYFSKCGQRVTKSEGKKEKGNKFRTYRTNFRLNCRKFCSWHRRYIRRNNRIRIRETGKYDYG